MTLFWIRRRPSLTKRIVGSLLILVATAGLAAGAEALRRKLGLRSSRVEVVRNGRRARVRVSLRAPRGGRRRIRSISAARS